VVTRYRISLEDRHYTPFTINLRLAAMRRLAYEAAGCDLLSPDLAAAASGQENRLAIIRETVFVKGIANSLKHGQTAKVRH
jgi:hypothetical protein